MVDSSKYIKMFVSETQEQVNQINELLPAYEKERANKESLNSLFRAFHSIKGMAASMGYREIQEVSHKLEDLLEGIRSGNINCSDDFVDMLFEGASLIDGLVQLIEDNSAEKVNTEPFKERLVAAISLTESAPPIKKFPHPLKDEPISSPGLTQAELDTISKAGSDYYRIDILISRESISPQARSYLIIEAFKGKKIEVVSRPSPEQIERGDIDHSITLYMGTCHDEKVIRGVIESSVEIEKSEIQKIRVVTGSRADDTGQLIAKPEEGRGGAPKNSIRYRKPSAVKVDTRTLNQLIDIVGEMFIRENQLMDIARTVDSPEIAESVSMLEKQVRKLHKEVVDLRMIPVSMLADMIPRVIREVIKDTGKKIDIDVSGKDIMLDRSIVEKLGDPVIHLIRNCIDHGIELPEERESRGKAVTGKIVFKARRERDFIIIELSDDGKGIDPEIVREKIIEKGLASKEMLDGKTDEELFNYIWLPGFSTARRVTSVSGRGVGMDIVKSVVEGLGGEIRVSSKPGQGCSFYIKVPLTIAIVKTFRIVLNEELFAVSMTKVLRTLSIPEKEIRKGADGAFFSYMEDNIPLFSLKTLLKMDVSKKHNPPPQVQILVVDSGAGPLGLVIDSFVAGYETVIKPLGPPLEKVKAISGASMSEKGEIILILDVDRIVNMALEEGANRFSRCVLR